MGRAISPSQSMIPKKLTILDEAKLIKHLHSMKTEDRRLRFGSPVNDDYIVSYVQKTLGKPDNKWFGVEVDGNIIAACHTAKLNDTTAELGCSVDAEYRGNGLAQKLFDRTVVWLKTRNIRTVYMHCLSENAIMRHIARKNDMKVVSEYGESDANVDLDPQSPFDAVIDAYVDRMALYDMMYKNNIKAMKNFIPKYWYDESKSIA